MRKRFFKEFWFTVFVILALYFLCPKMWGMGKKSLLTAQLADTIKLADRVTGIENAQLKLADKLDGQAVAQMGLQNSVNKVSSEIKVGGNLINESSLMKDYIQSMKDSHTELVTVMWKIIGLLIVQLVGIIGAFGGYMFFTIKSLLNARDKDDEREDAMKEKGMGEEA